MCTCITYENGGFYFGRNLDLDVSFGQTVTVTPEKFPLNFRKTKKAEKHYAMIGMASDNDAFPLYAEAVNEKGLAMAGLNFPGNAYYLCRRRLCTGCWRTGRSALSWNRSEKA